MDKYREPNSAKAYVWICKTLILVLCASHQIVCHMLVQTYLIEKALMPREETQEQLQDRLLESSRKFMTSHMNKGPSISQKMIFNISVPYQSTPSFSDSRRSNLTVFDISEFQNESDIPEEITDVYEHDILKITCNYDKEKKTPEEQHAILKRLYKAIRFQNISKLIVSRLFTDEEKVKNNRKINVACDVLKNTQKKPLQHLELEYVSFRTAQWIRVYFSCLKLKTLKIETNREDMLSVTDYISISNLLLLQICYTPNPNTLEGQRSEIRRRPRGLSIKNTFILKSTVPIDMPEGMFEMAKKTLCISYVIFKNIDFEKMGPENVKCLFIVMAPFRDFMSLIGGKSKNTIQTKQLNNLKEITIFVEPPTKKNPTPLLSEQDVITILQWAAGLTRKIEKIKISNVDATPECKKILKDHPERVLSITPAIKEILIGFDLFPFGPEEAPITTTRPPATSNPTTTNSTTPLISMKPPL